MATTSIYALPYQTLSDPPHGPDLGQNLAEAVETELDRIDTDVTALQATTGVLTRCGCRLRAEAQAIPTSTPTNITWSTEDEDTDAFHTGSSETVTIPSGKGGLYMVTLVVRRNGTTNLLGSRVFASIAITSSLTGVPADVRIPSNGTEDIVTVTYTGPLAAGDSFVCAWYHEHGSNYTPLSWLSCYRIGA